MLFRQAGIRIIAAERVDDALAVNGGDIVKRIENEMEYRVKSRLLSSGKSWNMRVKPQVYLFQEEPFESIVHR